MGFSMDDYVDVAERLRILKEKYPLAVLRPFDPANPYKVETIGDKTFIVYTAVCYKEPNDPNPAIATAWEEFPGRTQFTRGSELMNAETSAWGRVIVAALVSDTKKIASLQEVRNRQAENEVPQKTKVAQKKVEPTTDKACTEDQRESITQLAASAGIKNIKVVVSDVIGRQVGSSKELTAAEATSVIAHLIEIQDFANPQQDPAA